MTTTTHQQAPVTRDPRHTFLRPAEVFARYRWGRTKGYEMLRARPDAFPRAIGGAYRLDLLMAWEDAQVSADADTSVEGSDVPVAGARDAAGDEAAARARVAAGTKTVA